MGGRYCHKFIPKPGTHGESAPLTWEWKKDGFSDRKEPPMGVDIIRVGDMDKAAMKAAKVAGRQEYVSETVAKCEIPADQADRMFQEKREGHEAWLKLAAPRPRGKEYGEWLKSNGFPLAAVLSEKCWDSPDIPAGVTAADWVADAPFLTGFAFLREQKWYEQGKMGWWAIVADEKEQKSWEAEFHELVSAVPDDWYLTVVDCHI